MIKALYRVDFTEFERGWGMRPDGYILATSFEIAYDVIKDVESRGSIEIYARANCDPRLVEVKDDAVYNTVVESDKGYKWY